MIHMTCNDKKTKKTERFIELDIRLIDVIW
jgi:hypothetical protein